MTRPYPPGGLVHGLPAGCRPIRVRCAAPTDGMEGQRVRFVPIEGLTERLQETSYQLSAVSYQPRKGNHQQLTADFRRLGHSKAHSAKR